MKYVIILFLFTILLGCEDEYNADSADTIDPAVESLIEEINEKLTESNLTDESSNSIDSNGNQESVEEHDDDNIDLTEEEEAEEVDLSQYSSEDIEYARIWLQLGLNQEIDELNVTIIPAGSPIHPTFEQSALYPEDVVQLTGPRLIDGSVIYSSNGDGTINIYHVPLRWEANTPEDFDEEDMIIFTESIVENTELIEVEVGEDQEVIELIKKIKKHGG